MNKNIAFSLLLFFAAALIVMLSGCTSNNIGREQQALPFAIEARQVEGMDYSIIISNDSNEAMFFGGCNDYLLEKMEGNEWKIVQEKQCVWEGQAKTLLAGKSIAFEDAIAEPGTYRVRLDFGLGCKAEYPLSQADCRKIGHVFSKEFIVEEAAPKGIFACSIDSDCAKASEGCCPCNSGGKEISVNKEALEQYMAGLGCGQDLACTALYACTEKKPKCSEGKCVLS